MEQKEAWYADELYQKDIQVAKMELTGSSSVHPSEHGSSRRQVMTGAMKLTKERIAWLREILKTAEYCHIGTWNGEMAFDVLGDLEDALDDLAELEELLKDVPGDTLEQKILRMFHELEQANG